MPIEGYTERDVARLWAKIDVGGDCWEWTSYKRTGYGTFRLCAVDGIPGARFQAHRFVWELLVGPIPDGMQLDHLCRNRACVNPDHLEIVTNRENARRGIAAAKRLHRTHCAKGHKFTPETTGHQSGTGFRFCRICSREAVRLSTRRKRERDALGEPSAV